MVLPKTSVLGQPDAARAGSGLAFPEIGPDPVQILSVSPVEDDHVTLKRVLSGTGCVVRKALSLRSGLAQLDIELAPVVICERDLMPGSWRDLLIALRGFREPPFLIVTSRQADEVLWSQALNLGAYDVLAKPFDAAEIVRVVSLAWLHWRDQYPADSMDSLRVMAAH